VVILIEDITEKEVLDRSRDEFFSIASHELRTPLTAIKGNTSMIMDFYAEALKDPELKSMVYDIHESSTRLIDIVNDFLDVSRLEQGKVSFTYEAVALEEIVEGVMYEMRAVLKEKKLSLEFNHKTLGNLPKIWTDKNRLKQILYNLVGNATKFTEKGSISIDVQPEKTHLRVRVIDTGRGISTENQKLLFHKFQQANTSLLTRDTTRGTGLGLYISKMMAEMMDGEMGLEKSEEGKGSVFYFTVPIDSPDERQKVNDDQSAKTTNTATGRTAASQPTASTTQHSSLPYNLPKGSHLEQIKLLIVEDDPYVIRLYQRLFSLSKLNVRSAVNGQEGIELAKAFKPDIILLDVMMPVMNGLDALKILKSEPTTSHIPVIMLSSFGEESAVQQAKQSGAADYLIKSNFTPEQVLIIVEDTLRAKAPAKATKAEKITPPKVEEKK
jgi:CheY-like chemotaxis protein/anti-sigma regulatory factor (Ser/Thr protein kinase)